MAGLVCISVHRWTGIYNRSRSDRQRLGEVQRKRSGVVIQQVLEDSPAAKAGLQFVICCLPWLATVKSVEEAIFWIGNKSPGSVVPFTIVRDGEQKVIDVTIVTVRKRSSSDHG